jgi:hypothetical protein
MGSFAYDYIYLSLTWDIQNSLWSPHLCAFVYDYIYLSLTWDIQNSLWSPHMYAFGTVGICMSCCVEKSLIQPDVKILGTSDGQKYFVSHFSLL